MCRAVSSMCRSLDTGLLSSRQLFFKAALRVRDRLAGPAVLLANHALITNDRTLGDIDLPCHRAFIQARFTTGKGAFLHSLTSRSRDINAKCPGGVVESEVEHLRGSLRSCEFTAEICRRGKGGRARKKQGSSGKSGSRNDVQFLIPFVFSR